MSRMRVEELVQDRIALNSWTLDTTAPADLIGIARQAGYAAVELRMADFNKLSAPDGLIDAVRRSRLTVTSLGADGILVQADPDAQAQWFDRLHVAADICGRLDCDTIMVSTGMANGTSVANAAGILLEAAAKLEKSGIRLAYEFNAFHPTLNTLEHALALLAAADRPGIGLALDSYHMERSDSWDRLSGIQPERLFCLQISDVPSGTSSAAPLDRLPPGQGVIDWKRLFRFVDRADYRGRISFEAPNPATWGLDAAFVARDGLLSITELWHASRRVQ